MVRRLIACLSAALVVAGLLAAAGGAAPANATATSLTWSTPKLVDPPHGFASISCPSRTLCRAGDAGNRIERWNGTTWAHGRELPPAAADGVVSISCTSATFCAGVQLLHTAMIWDKEYRPIVRRADGSWNVSAATVTLPTEFENPDISCASASFCMIVGQAKYQVWNGSTWSAPARFARYGSFDETVSCPSASRCVMASAYGDIYRWNGHSWSTPHRIAGSNVIQSVDCPTTTSCTVLTGHGARRGNGTTWGKVVTFDKDVAGTGADYLTDLSCPTAKFCEAVDSRGYAFTYTAHSGWGGRHRVAQGWSSEPQVSCAGTRLCQVITVQGQAIARVDGRWRSPRLADPAMGGSPTADCASSTLCLSVDINGAGATFDGSTWTAPKLVAAPPRGFTDLSCPSSSMCMATVGSQGVRIRSGGTWGAPIPVTDHYRFLTDVSCGTPSLCVMHSLVGGYVYLWNGSTFRHVPPPTTDTSVEGSCASDGCVIQFDDLIDNDGATKMYAADGTTHTYPPIGVTNNSTHISCTSISFCMSDGKKPWMFDGSSWSVAPTAGTFDAADVSCTSSTFCVAVGGNRAYTWDGSSWSTAQTVVQNAPGFLELESVSCKGTVCAAIDQYGWAVTATVS